jgi:BON domain
MRKMGTLFAAAFMVAVLAAGCSNAKNDQALATDLKARMFSDPQVKTLNFDIAVKNGDVTLSGDVPNDAARYQAFKIASDTPGVKHVVDHMTVQTADAAPGPEPPPAEPPPAPKQVRRTHVPRGAQTESKPLVSDSEAVAPPAPPAAPAVAPAEQPEAATEPPPPPPPPQPIRVEVPAGTSVRIQMIDGVDSAVNHAGELFRATLAAPIVLNNEVVVPSGTDVYVKLLNAKSAGHMAGQSQLVLELVRMEYQGISYALVSNQYDQTGSSRGKRTAETVGGGAVLGALLGAVIGHGKGAAIGAATGAGAGTIAQAATKGQQVQVPSETKLDFTLEQPVQVSYFPGKNASSR